MDRSKRGKPRVQDEEGVKDGDNREDDSRRDKRPKPVGPATTSLDKAMSEGVISPDPDTPSRTPRE
ncbi:MAG: hypothetical protein H0T96_02585 [Thermoleophilaceae bacterium]|jgi:hypothetical protein|nr:hypothetical protein [Thermoleophilaceae bacterium]